MSTLAPCPFCGGHADKDPVLKGQGVARVYSVFCRRCLAFGPPVGTRERAIEEWNRRGNMTTDCLADALCERQPAGE